MIQQLWFWIAISVGSGVFWLLPDKWRMPFLGILSFGLLFRMEPVQITVLTCWTLLCYVAFQRTSNHQSAFRKVALAIIVGSLSLLIASKYLLPLIAHVFSPDSPTYVFAVPLGISYFTFKFVHYAIERSRDGLPDHTLTEFLCYILLFPIFTSGPIERFDHFLAERSKSYDRRHTLEGITRIVQGLVKKFVVGNLLIMPLFGFYSSAELIPGLLDTGFGVSTVRAWRFVILSFLYVYMDFSGYSDIAIGASRLFGFRIMENFNWPVFAPNIGAFWKRWHMTLAGWCQTYVYLTLIGISRNPYLAVFATFLTIGLWHGLSFNWVIWGLYHGIGVSAFLTWTRIKSRKRLKIGNSWWWIALSTFVTFLFVASSFAFSATYQLGDPVLSMRLFLRLFFI